MNSIHRRDFLFASSGATAGAFLAPGVAEVDAAEPTDFAQSGLVTGQPKPLKHKSIPGFLSAEQIAPHHTAHYGGALKAASAADTRLEQTLKSDKEIDPAAFAHLKRLINSRSNSVILHEMYFDGLSPKAPDPHVKPG